MRYSFDSGYMEVSRFDWCLDGVVADAYCVIAVIGNAVFKDQFHYASYDEAEARLIELSKIFE